MIRLKQKENRDNVFQMLIASMLSIVVCTVCLVGGTFAWFTATETISTQGITAGKLEVQAIVTESEISSGVLGEGEISTAFMPEEDDGIYSLSSEKEYSVMLNVNGTVTQGFCIIKIGDDYKYTEPIILEEGKASYTFSITAYEAADFFVIPCWGTVKNNPKAAELFFEDDAEESSVIRKGLNIVIGKPSAESEEDNQKVVQEEIIREIAIDETEIKNITWKILGENQKVIPEAECQISLNAFEGYHLPGKVTIKIDEASYDVSTKNLEQGEVSVVQTEASRVPTFDANEGILTIPAALLTKDTELVQIQATAVADEPEGGVTEDVPVQGETEVLPEQVEPAEPMPPVSQNESVDAQVEEPSIDLNTPVNPQMPSQAAGQPDVETPLEPTEPSNTETPSEPESPKIPDEEVTEDTEKVIKSTDSEETTELPEIEE